ncbi:NnrU family protein [Rubrivivax gelatinosus]|uniref:NnrU family protein n=1 Tax=Rubrivivax gelatinosus (strain NBRC 100245 / IL144) TaxID=983917 RepID=I0HK42_RUBGI|nr:NnrU family protein [Rubrivivax gelatinosus]MBG6080000.1 putative membrane protein [Rubrivivax gelatinosus]BAL93379.1 NnrU family protein [Rubrivivax gelatinosus IL144]
MTQLILGLVLFLGAHSVRIYGDDWRTRMRARLGENGFKGLYSVLSLLGLVLIVRGYGDARLDPVALWTPMLWTRHLAALLVLVAFVLNFAAYVPGNQIKARLHHPMILGVKVWAFAHLLANHTLADLVLFGSFLVWAVLDYRAARQRDARAGTVYAPGRLSMTLVTVAVGVAGWAVFAFWLHGWLFGVRPFG